MDLSDAAAPQDGLMTRAQLGALGVNRWSVAHRVSTGVWQAITPTVIATFSGGMSRRQRMWAAVLHGGPGALVVGATALEVHGLKRWEREEIQVGVPHTAAPSKCLDGVRFERSRRPLAAWASPGRTLPTLRLQPAILMFASHQRSDRARVAVLAAAIQQRLTTSESLVEWLGRLAPLRAAAGIRSALADLADGAQSMAEVDVTRMCTTFRLARAIRQVKRRDSTGRTRFTDCEWRLADGRVLILEVDGGFHMDADRWEDDIVRQRGLSDPRVLMVRCTARELRDCPDQVAHDLIRLGVPRLGDSQ